MRHRQSDQDGTGLAELLSHCIDGNQQAWDELVERYSRLVFSIALKSGLTASDADDVMQNVFITVLRRLDSLRDPERFSSWLITTTRRESWRYKKSMRDVAIDETAEIEDDSPVAIDEVIAWEQSLTAHRGLQLLGERCRRLLTFLFLDDSSPSYEYISNELEIAVGSIGPIRARCLKQLRGHLADLGHEHAR